MEMENGEIRQPHLDETLPVAVECRHCDATVIVAAGDWFLYEGRIVVDRRDSLCPPHQEAFDRGMERSRQYSGDVPPSWFDPSYAGEEW